MFKNIEKLKGKIPEKVYNELIKIDAIDGPLRCSHFVAQNHHESAGFTRMEENLNYSDEGLLKIFPKYFTVEQAKAYKRMPERIANRVYANRMNNGNEASGDGWKYRGRGYIQLTGRDNYTAFSKWIGDVEIINNPDLIITKYSLISAAYFFTVNNLWGIADKGIDDETITRMTKRINGGTIGLSHRIELTKYYYSILKN